MIPPGTNHQPFPGQKSDALSLTGRFVHALRRQSWRWTVLNLAWTAGPVTYLAIQGGHYLGFGKAPPWHTFIYFAGYTVIAGLLAVIAQIIRSVFYEPRLAAREQALQNTVDGVFMLYFAARNAFIRSYPPTDRPLIAAWWTLRSAGTDVDMLQEAVRDTTGDASLAAAMKRIELFRKQGMPDVMWQEYAGHADTMSYHTQKLAARFPDLAKELEKRFRGEVPTLRDGLQRHTGFLERLLLAANQDKPEVLTGEDVLSIIQLVLELLLDRVFLSLHPRFTHFKRLDETRAHFDSLLSDFWLLRRKRNSRMRALIDYISSLTGSRYHQTLGADSIQLQDMLLTSLAGLSAADARHPALRQRYQEILQLNARLQQLWHKLAGQERSYNRQWAKDAQSFTKQVTQSREKPALVIREREIAFSYRQKMKMAAQTEQILQELTIRRHSLESYRENEHSAEPISLDDYKILAMELLNALDDILHISEPEEQLAIEESRQADFGCIEPNLASATKIYWGRLIVQELQYSRTQIAHRLAGQLVHFYNLPLGEGIIDYLVGHYDASRDYLESLPPPRQHPGTTAADTLRSAILEFPEWQRLFVGIQ